MSVFFIGNIDIRDFEKYRNSGYLENAARTITGYGGRYRVRGGQTKIIEGQPVFHRLVVIEFPSMESFESWYSSDAYTPWKKIMPPHTPNRKQKPLTDTEISLSLVSFPKPN